MTALILRLIAALWRPLATLLGAFGLYAKGRADAALARDLRDAQAYRDTVERTTDAPVHTDPADARQRMRDRDPRKP